MEEWTKEETGVGAAIAAGSQEEKGYWALFVIAPKIIMHIKKFVLLVIKNSICIEPEKYILSRERIKKASPMRFIKKVNKPPSSLL